MAQVTKNDVNQIFANDAPAQDKPPSFNNYTQGWNESRTNNGKPTIKQMNFLQQRNDNNVLWIHQNGGALPYDESIEYNDGVIVLKDGKLQQLRSGVWSVYGANDTDITTWSGQTQDKENKAFVTTVNSLQDLDTLSTSENRNAYVKNIGIYRYNATNSAWERDLVTEKQVITVESITDLVDVLTWDGRTVYVKSYYKATNFALAKPYKGGSTYVYVAERANENSITCKNGWVNQQPNLASCGAHLDGIQDDSAVLQLFHDYVAEQAQKYKDPFNGMYVPQEIVIDGALYLSSTINIRGDLVRFSGLGGAGIFAPPTGNYTDNYLFKVGGVSVNASYSAQTGSLFENILFKSTDQKLDLFFVGSDSNTGSHGGHILKNVNKCSFFGFRRIFSNGISGWGWNFSQCQACLCENWVYFISAEDSGERLTFTGCIWMNGGYAFNFAGGVCPIYWHGGSFDYCTGVVLESVPCPDQILITLSSHFEWSASESSQPAFNFLTPNIAVSVGGLMTISNSSTKMYSICQQQRDKQVRFNDLFFSGGAGWGDFIQLDAKYNVNTKRVALPSDTEAKYRSASKCAERILDLTNAKTFADITVTAPSVHAYQMTKNGIVVSSVSGGGDGNVIIDIPVDSETMTLFSKIDVVNSSRGDIYVIPYLLNSNKVVVYDNFIFSDIKITTSTKTVNTGLIDALPAGVSYLRLLFNMYAVGTDAPFTISQIHVFTQ